MSVTNEKRTTGAVRREARVQQERKEKKRIRIVAVTIVLILALLLAGSLFLNSKIARRYFAAIKFGDESFTATEYEYFFYSTYLNYRTYMYQMMGENAASSLPSTDKSLKSQTNAQTGETWYDFFRNMAIQQIGELVQYHEEATKNGWVMPDSDRAKMDENISEAKSTALNTYATSFEQYLQNFYGQSMNETIFLKLVEYMTYSTSYSTHMRDAKVYTTEELSAYYSEHKDDLDWFTFRVVHVDPESIDESQSESAEMVDIAKEVAQDDAEKKAKEIADGIHSEDDFIAAGKEISDEYAEDDITKLKRMGENLDGDYKEWLLDPERKPGDVGTVKKTLDPGGAYILYFIYRDDNSYEMTGMRQILIRPKEISADEYPDDAEAYEAAVDAEKARTAERADAIYAKFIEGGATEEKLIELIDEKDENGNSVNTDDTTEGGLYKDVAKNMFVQEIEDWLFDPARKIGDYALVESERYGYHLVYFTGFYGRYCDQTSETRLREEDYNNWKESLPKYESEELWGMKLAA